MADYRRIIPLFKEKEGGLSNDSRDVSAAKNPAPCTYKGQTGWHTNKGITWATFSSMANKLGYQATCENFFAMPDDIWEKIFKAGIWDRWGLDDVKQQSIADSIMWWSWGSGEGGATSQLTRFLKENYNIETGGDKQKIKNAFDSIVKDVNDEKKVFQQMIDFRIKFLESLSNCATYCRGWKNALQKFVDLANRYFALLESPKQSVEEIKRKRDTGQISQRQADVELTFISNYVGGGISKNKNIIPVVLLSAGAFFLIFAFLSAKSKNR
jgi:lysozyme family protein